MNIIGNDIPLQPKSITKSTKYQIYDRKERIKDEPRPGAQDSGASGKSEQVGELCYMTKEVLNLEEASAFLGIAKSTLYKMTHLNQLPYFKPAGKLIFFEKRALLDWVRGARAMSEEEIRLEAASRLNEMNSRP